MTPGAAPAPQKTGQSDTLRLCYVDGPWAWFAPCDPTEVWGDDWNDAPHDCNAGIPYTDRIEGGCLLVAYDGDLSVAGVQWDYPPASTEHPHGYSVQEINRGEAPWLYQPSYGLPQFPEPKMVIPAGVTFAEFIELVAQAGGHVYTEEGRTTFVGDLPA